MLEASQEDKLKLHMRPLMTKLLYAYPMLLVDCFVTIVNTSTTNGKLSESEIKTPFNKHDMLKLDNSARKRFILENIILRTTPSTLIATIPFLLDEPTMRSAIGVKLIGVGQRQPAKEGRDMIQRLCLKFEIPGVADMDIGAATIKATVKKSAKILPGAQSVITNKDQVPGKYYTTLPKNIR